MPALFSEAVLEQAIIDKFKAEGYDYVSGDNLHRELTACRRVSEAGTPDTLSVTALCVVYRKSAAFVNRKKKKSAGISRRAPKICYNLFRLPRGRLRS